MLERKKDPDSCKLLKDWKYDTWLDVFCKKVEIEGRALMFSRGEVTKIDKGSLHMIQIKEIMRIYLREVSDIGRKRML